MTLFHGDCLEVMKTLPDKSIDLFICDLPYGETNCKWDSVIDMKEFWKQFKRLRKSKRSACIHFCSTRFGYTLIKSWEKGFKMDMVWKKRNKTGGLCSRLRPMRNHEMVYFFYEQAPKYNRDKYHKRINLAKIDKSGGKNAHGFENNIEGASLFTRGLETNFSPPNPVSILEENQVKVIEEEKKTISAKDRKAHGEKNFIYTKENQTFNKFEPSQPGSVIENKEIDEFGWSLGKLPKENRGKEGFTPVLPTSVVQQKELKCIKNPTGMIEKTDIYSKEKQTPHVYMEPSFTPPNPASVLEQLVDHRINEKGKSPHGWDITHMDKPRVAHFEPKLPLSVLEEDEEYVIAEENEPKSMYESTKCFIGKRHHQTEKPQDILEFFLKYWSDEGDTILDPTMGSGSTGVACKKMGRKFIGIELTEKFFAVAENRISNAL
jgi:DNA modification methylase